MLIQHKVILKGSDKRALATFTKGPNTDLANLAEGTDAYLGAKSTKVRVGKSSYVEHEDVLTILMEKDVFSPVIDDNTSMEFVKIQENLTNAGWIKQ
jgi:hypothetical protein